MRVKPLLAATLFGGMMLIPATAVGQGLMFTGYADLELNVEKAGSGNSEFFFDNHHFNLIAVGKLFKDVSATAEVEYEHAGDEIALEFGYVTYTGFRNVRISAGKFLVPFGRFNKDLHPTWINKMVDRPNGFKHIMPVGYNDVGVWISGAAPVGESGARFVYDGFVVNGLLGEDGGDIRGLRDNITDELSAGGVDNNKSVGGRLGLDLAPQGLEFGGSFYVGNYLDSPDSNLTLAIFGGDLSYHRQGFEFRAEGVVADQEATGGDLTKKGGYAQAAYQIQGKYEPVVRFSFRDMPGNSEDTRRFSVGFNYYLSPNAVVRVDYHINKEDSGFGSENNKFAAQIAMVF